MALVGADGKTAVSTEMIEVGGFKFNKVALQNNPIEFLVSLVALDPSPLQIELMNKLDLVLKDAEGNVIFEPVEEKNKEEE